MSTQQRNAADQRAVSADQPARDARDELLIQALKEHIPHIMRQFGTPGLNLALARQGTVIWEEGFGYADIDKQIPMTPKTVLHSGSMGKLYTATATMQLVDSGLIGLYDPINRYLHEFQVINPFGEREITFYDLLTHRSGLTTNAAGSDFAPPQALGQHLKEGYSRETFKIYEGTVLPRWSAKVGQKYQYSNFGMATLGYLVEVINPEGLSFSDYVQKNILEPLGMTSTMYPPVQDAKHVPGDIIARFSKGYAHFGPVHLPTPTIYFADYPAGTVVTTPGDHIRLLLAFQNEGNYNGFQLLKPETVRLMLTPQHQVEADGKTAQVGLVWNIVNAGSEEYAFGHSGAHMYGWTNISLAFPVLDFCLVVAVNHWPMVTDDERYGAGQVISKFIATWLKRMDGHRELPDHSWAWKLSYVIGLMMVERLKGGLGIQSPITEAMVETMVRGVKEDIAQRHGAPAWDPDGFRAGIDDMLSVEMTLPAIQEFLRSERLKVLYEELPTLYRELGSSGRSLLPWILWTEES